MMKTGLTYTSTVVVSKENVAATMGSGDLNVFATPAMVAVSYTHLRENPLSSISCLLASMKFLINVSSFSIITILF